VDFEVTFDGRHWQISPDPAEVPAGTTVRWGFYGQRLSVPLRWTGYFHHGTPFRPWRTTFTVRTEVETATDTPSGRRRASGTAKKDPPDRGRRVQVRRQGGKPTGRDHAPPDRHLTGRLTLCPEHLALKLMRHAKFCEITREGPGAPREKVRKRDMRSWLFVEPASRRLVTWVEIFFPSSGFYFSK